VGIVDGILIGMLVFGAVVGLVKGLVRQLIELVGVIGSFFIAMLFSRWLAEALEAHTAISYSPALVVSFLLLLAAGIIGLHFVAVAVHNLVHMTFLGWVDRFSGAALGLIVAMLVSSTLVTITLQIPVPDTVHQAVEHSNVGAFLQPIAPWLFDAVFSHGRHGLSFEDIFRRGSLL